MAVDLDFEYLSRIRQAFALRSIRKSSNILEGDFRSIYRGRSMEFDELADYHEGDEVHDIDWNASSRTGQILVRKYVAERKHYILFVLDCGKKMTGHTAKGEDKASLACLSLGSAAYLCDRLGADYSLLYARNGQCIHDLFRAGMTHLEKLLYTCTKQISEEAEKDADALLNFAAENIKKRMIIVTITDIAGISALSEKTIGKVTEKNDLLVLRIDDAFLTDERAYDLESARYADTFLPPSKKLKRMEHEKRQEILEGATRIFKKNKVGFVSVSSQDEVIDQIIALFRQRQEMR